MSFLKRAFQSGIPLPRTIAVVCYSLQRVLKLRIPFVLWGPKVNWYVTKCDVPPWNKMFLRHHCAKRMPQNRASPLHMIFEFYFIPHFCQKISFPTLPVLSAPVHSHRISGFQAQGIGRRNNDGLRQLNFVWILVLFLAGHSVLPQQQDLSGSTQSFSRSFPAIQSQQTLAPCSVGAQMGFQRSVFLIELLSHSFPSGVFSRKSRTK